MLPWNRSNLEKRGLMMANTNNFTLEQLRNLKDLEAQPAADVKIAIIPQSRGSQSEGFGSVVVWRGWLFRKGVQGPREPTVHELEGAGLARADAEEWAERTQRAVTALNRLYPALTDERVAALERAARGELPETEPPRLPAGNGS